MLSIKIVWYDFKPLKIIFRLINISKWLSTLLSLLTYLAWLSLENQEIKTYRKMFIETRGTINVSFIFIFSLNELEFRTIKQRFAIFRKLTLAKVRNLVLSPKIIYKWIQNALTWWHIRWWHISWWHISWWHSSAYNSSVIQLIAGAWINIIGITWTVEGASLVSGTIYGVNRSIHAIISR